MERPLYSSGLVMTDDGDGEERERGRESDRREDGKFEKSRDTSTRLSAAHHPLTHMLSFPFPSTSFSLPSLSRSRDKEINGDARKGVKETGKGIRISSLTASVPVLMRSFTQKSPTINFGIANFVFKRWKDFSTARMTSHCCIGFNESPVVNIHFLFMYSIYRTNSSQLNGRAGGSEKEH